MTLQEFLTHFPDARPRAGGYGARCPAHDDKKASLQISQGDEGLVLFCHAGCPTKAILDAKALTFPSLLPIPPNSGTAVKRNGVTKWTIHDTQGVPVAVKCRVDGPDGKRPWWETPDGTKGLKGKPLKNIPLYNSQKIPQYDREKPLFLCEGEKDTDAVLSLGAQAVGTVGGSKTLPGRAVLASLTGFRDVRLFADNDDSGKQHMRAVGGILTELGAGVSLLQLEGLPKKGGATEWVEQQKSRHPTQPELLAALLALPRSYPFGGIVAKKTPGEEAKPTTTPRLTRVHIADFLSRKIQPQEELFGPWLRQKTTTMVYAPPGVGKTYFALSLAYALASGGEFLRWRAPRARGVLYVDGEMTEYELQQRLLALDASSGPELAAPLYLVSAESEAQGIPDLATPEGQRAIEEQLPGVDLVILDNLSCLLQSGSENEAESWISVQAWLTRLKFTGVAIVYLHHTGKNGTQRGTSKKLDSLHNVIRLQRPESYIASDGARFELHFEKSRGVYGPPVDPLEARLCTDPDGNQVWAWQNLEASKKARIKELADSGLGPRAIAREMGCVHSYVVKVLKEA